MLIEFAFFELEFKPCRTSTFKNKCGNVFHNNLLLYRTKETESGLFLSKKNNF